MIQILVDGLIFQKDPHGGIARIFRELLPRLCDLAPDLRVTLFIDGPLRQDLPAHPQITVRRAPPLRRTVRVQGAWRAWLYPFRRLASRLWGRARRLWLGSGQNVIWHSTYYTLPPSWEGPQVVTVYDMVHERFPQFYNDPLDEVARRQKRRCVESAEAVICISEATRQAVGQLYGIATDAFHVIPLAHSHVFRQLDAPYVLPRSLGAVSASPVGGSRVEVGAWRLADTAEPFLLYVGNRAHYKNFSGLVDAYSRWKQREQVSLVVVGAPWTSQEKHLLERAGIAQRVTVLSRVDDESLCLLYNRAAAFVFPSLDEGFGIPLLEALACGCPVVASRIPSSLEVAGDIPIYFDLAEPETLLSALDQALQEGKNTPRQQMGLERVKAFSWERAAQQTLEVYRGLADA